MSNPQQTTKIEQVTEAIEALVLAQTVAITSGGGHHFHEQILIARTELADALKELLTPTLRVVTGPVDAVSRVKLETIPAPDARPAYPVA